MAGVQDDSAQTVAKPLSQIHLAAGRFLPARRRLERAGGFTGFRALAPSPFGVFRDARGFGPYVNHEALGIREGENPVFDVTFFRYINHEAQPAFPRLAEPEARYDAASWRKFRNLGAPLNAPARNVNKYTRGIFQGVRFETKRFAVQYEDYPRIARGGEFPDSENSCVQSPRAKGVPPLLRPENKKKTKDEK